VKTVMTLTWYRHF